jgi:hypothetical protein
MRARLPLYALIALAPTLCAASACGGTQSDASEANESLEGIVVSDNDQTPTTELVTIEQGEPMAVDALGALTDEELGALIGFSLPEGPACASSSDCDAGQFCAFDVGHCGETDTPGVCMTPPDMCTMDWSPVCGCDGQTYGNVCGAWAASANPVHFGECEATPDSHEEPIAPESDGATAPPPVEPDSNDEPASMPSE